MSDHRTLEQLREHYEIEKELANRLRYASKQEGRYLYSTLYDELIRRVALLPQLTRKRSPIETAKAVESQMAFLKPFLAEDTRFMVIGPGDCSLSYEVAKYVTQVYAIDVSDEITRVLKPPDNFQLILSDGCSIPVPHSSINVTYSHHLMKHLHPDDVFEQLQNIYNALDAGGFYICITPNRLTGPHDISKYFDVVATGFQLREYTISELRTLFRKVRFSRFRLYAGGRGIYLRFPAISLLLCERLLLMLPLTLRNPIARSLPVRVLLNRRFLLIK